MRKVIVKSKIGLSSVNTGQAVSGTRTIAEGLLDAKKGFEAADQAVRSVPL